MSQAKEAVGYKKAVEKYNLYHADCFTWMQQQPENSIHAIVTDPLYGLKEYTPEEKEKLRKRRGGVWRIPPSFDGCQRGPLPRFTVLTQEERKRLFSFFVTFAERAFKVLVPGGHVFIATNPILSQLVYVPLIDAGFEKRRRGDTPRSNTSWRGSAKKRPQRILGCDSDAPVRLGTMGAFSEVV